MSKSPLRSKGVVGGLAAALAGVVGVKLGLDEHSTAVVATGLASLLGGVLSAAGRYLAKVRIGGGGGRTLLPLAVAAMALTSAGACAVSDWTPPAECEDGNSVIMGLIPNPAEADLVLRLANLELLRGDAYTAEQAEEVLAGLLLMLDGPVDYGEFAARALAGIEWLDSLAPEIFIISQYLGLFSGPGVAGKLITDCDKALIRAHIQGQMRVLAFAG